MAYDMMAKGSDKYTAEKAASKAVNMDEIQENIHNELYPAPVRVQTPRGIITLPKQGAAQLMRDHPDMHEVIG